MYGETELKIDLKTQILSVRCRKIELPTCTGTWCIAFTESKRVYLKKCETGEETAVLAEEKELQHAVQSVDRKVGLPQGLLYMRKQLPKILKTLQWL